GAQLANTGRGLPRPINGGDGAGRLTPCRAGAVNLWTVGCADPRLTAQVRSPMDKSRGKRDAFPPPCPQVGGCPQASQHPATTRDEFDFGESRNQQPANSLSLFSPEAVQTTATVAHDRRTNEFPDCTLRRIFGHLLVSAS